VAGRSHSRIVLRPVGTPLPLGFLGQMVGRHHRVQCGAVGWIPTTEGWVIAVAVLLFTVPVQLLASVFGFLARDPVARTGDGAARRNVGCPCRCHRDFASGNAHRRAWRRCAHRSHRDGGTGIRGVRKARRGRSNAMSALRFVTTGLDGITASPGWGPLPGSSGLVLAVGAFYAALGFEWEVARGRTVSPLLRGGGGRSALHAVFSSQVSNVAHEAGVRRQL